METPWQSTMRAFERELPMISLRKGTRLSFVLNSQYIRYRIVPWRTQFIAPVAHAAFVEHCFVDAFGEVARQWTFRASRSQYGKASLAAALDSELLESLDRCAASAGLRLVSAQPSLMHAFNHSRSAMQGNPYWFVLSEADRYTYLLMHDGEPTLLRQARHGDGALETLLEREWNAQGMEAENCPVYYFDPADGGGRSYQSERWHVTRLASSAVMSKAKEALNTHSPRAA